MKLEPPRLVVGLGNPGADYSTHRHNVGFRVVGELARRLGLVFRPEGRNYDLAEDADSGVILLKPLTYMNRSGDAVMAWSHDSGWPVAGTPDPVADPDADSEESDPAAGAAATVAAVEDRLVNGAPDDPPPSVRPLIVCDDLALPLGAVRLRARGSSGGQNGLASVIGAVGGEHFPRLRLGVASPAEGTVDPARWADYVLSGFAPEEREAADEMVAHACAALACWLEDGLEAAISRFNRRAGPAGD